VQDAANLGWKLAAVVSGWAPEGLLDTYHSERRAAGERLLMNTRAQGMIFLGGEASDPLRALLAELISYDDVKRHLAGIVSGLDIRYELGEGEHPLLGRRLAHCELAGPAGRNSTTELLHAGQGVLLDLADNVRLRATAEGWKDRVVTLTAVPADGDMAVFAEAAAVLVRPDGYVAAVPANVEQLRTALLRWFGEPL
jgi:bifunctional hydroxylase/dehydrase